MVQCQTSDKVVNTTETKPCSSENCVKNHTSLDVAASIQNSSDDKNGSYERIKYEENFYDFNSTFGFSNHNIHTIGNSSLFFSHSLPHFNTTQPSLLLLTQFTTPGKTLENGKSLLLQFNESYQLYHGYASFFVCIFGIAANLINISVLTRRTMISPTNLILTALAVSDLMTMIAYLPYAVYFHFISAPELNLIHPKGWIIYMVFHNLFVVTTHTISMWLTVALALFRYVSVCHPIYGSGLCTLTRAKQSIVLIFFITVIFCCPNYVMYQICQQTNGGYWFEENYFVVGAHKIFNFWLFGVVLKVVPCILLTVLSALLLRAMAAQNAKRKLLLQKKNRASITKTPGNFKRTTNIDNADIQNREQSKLLEGVEQQDPNTEKHDAFSDDAKLAHQLENDNLQLQDTKLKTNAETFIETKEQDPTCCPPQQESLTETKPPRTSRKSKESGGPRRIFQSYSSQERDRTTFMLVVVVLCFVIIELPQGILALMSGVNQDIFDEVYVPLGDFLDILVLINNSVNFILYCTMSAKFRSTFKEIFLSRWFKR